MVVEIATFVVEGTTQLTVTLDRQEGEDSRRKQLMSLTSSSAG